MHATIEIEVPEDMNLRAWGDMFTNLQKGLPEAVVTFPIGLVERTKPLHFRFHIQAKVIILQEVYQVALKAAPPGCQVHHPIESIAFPPPNG